MSLKGYTRNQHSCNFYVYAGNDPIMFWDLTGLKPGDCFSTPDKAAIDALKWIYEESLYLGKEMGGGIYQRGFGDISKYDVNESITFKIWQIKIGFPDAFYKKNVLSYNNEAVYDK